MDIHRFTISNLLSVQKDKYRVSGKNITKDPQSVSQRCFLSDKDA